MPLYEFNCARCGEEFEELVLSYKPDAVAQVACPTCGSHQVKKKVSAFATGSKGNSTAAAGAAGCAPRGGG